MTDTSQPLFLIGPGYSARALSAIWQGPATGTYRSEEGQARLRETGIVGVSVDDTAGLSVAVQGAHVIVSAPPEETGCPALQLIRSDVSSAASVSYLSTTGVYGDLGGGWAMEWTSINPQSERAARRANAEQAWQQVSDVARIVRLPGIYGPGRSAFDRLKRGTARRIVKPGHVFSRAHVDDIASGLQALISSSAVGVFNLCDDVAAPPQDVITYAADLMAMDPPPEIDFASADLSPMARSFYSECKRVSNARIKAVTGWRPKYPTYRDGLKAILAAAT